MWLCAHLNKLSGSSVHLHKGAKGSLLLFGKLSPGLEGMMLMHLDLRCHLIDQAA